MSTQIAVRLPDEMVAFLDRLVAAGDAPSRAALVASALEREMRRLVAEQDAQVLREAARGVMTKVTVAPITATIKGLSSEVRVGPDNGLDHNCVVSLDNVLTVPVNALGRTVGHLSAAQEVELARAVVLAYDLEVPLLE